VVSLVFSASIVRDPFMWLIVFSGFLFLPVCFHISIAFGGCRLVWEVCFSTVVWCWRFFAIVVLVDSSLTFLEVFRKFLRKFLASLETSNIIFDYFRNITNIE